ncbi:hypothetical protein Forpi1262_v017158 [Fusarium oxysporum f. sp. raphani]|uniref:Uncharacterized protein n=1 Tax=Fusarium oxysporum f. sp. raphani TaxID=96318 RepID=A0A8J5P7Y2_FUSOX|nr:hypothetical protein Forpi1262_v017158 [Fusarium oxysporum f. sp. raphani]
MTASLCDKPVLFCECTMRQANIGGIWVNPICKWCYEFVPNDKAIYMVLKDYVEQLQFLGTKGNKTRSKNKKKKKHGSGDLVDTLRRLHDLEDVKRLYEKYGFQAICSSVRVLMDITPSEKRYLSSAGCEDSPPAAEPVSDAPKEATDEEAAWEPQPEPSAEKAPPHDNCSCEPTVAGDDDAVTKDSELEVIEGDYVDVRGIEDKPYDDYGDDSASDKPADPEVEPRNIEEDTVEAYEAPAEEAKPSDAEETGQERAQEQRNTVYLPFDSQYGLMVQLQGVLERACFTYAQRHLPTLLRVHGWNCVEAVPLDTWMDQFASVRHKRVVGASEELLQSVARIQDTTVKRTPMDSSRIRKTLDDAARLIEVLRIEECGDIVEKIRLEVGKTIDDLGRQEEEARSDELLKLLQIDEKRRMLDEQERMVCAEKERKMKECQKSARLKVKRVLGEASITFETSTCSMQLVD